MKWKFMGVMRVVGRRPLCVGDGFGDFVIFFLVFLWGIMDTGKLVVFSSNCCIVMTSDQCPRYLHQLIHVEAADASSLSTKLQESGVCSGALPKNTPCSKAESFFFGSRMAEKAKGFRSELQVKSRLCFFSCFTLENLDIYIIYLEFDILNILWEHQSKSKYIMKHLVDMIMRGFLHRQHRTPGGCSGADLGVERCSKSWITKCF